MLLSVYCEAIRLILTQRMLQKLNFHVIEGLYFTAPVSAMWMLLLASVVEMHRLSWDKFVIFLEHW